MLEVLLSPVGIAVTAIVGLALVVANLVDALKPDKPRRTLYQQIKTARQKRRWKD